MCDIVSRGRRLVLILLVLGMAFTFVVYYAFMASEVDVVEVIAENAIVELSSWDEAQNSIELEGQWAYYEGYLYDEINGQTPTYVSIPENRKIEVSDNYYRYGTYILTVEGLKPNHIYGVFSGSQVNAYNLYINDRKILSNGQVGISPDTHVSEWKHDSGSFFADEQGRIVVAVEISNYEYQDGLFWNSPVIGDHHNIFNSHVIMILVNVILIVIFLCIAVVLLIIYMKYKQDISSLYFVILLVNMIVRMMVTSNKPILLLIDDVPWSLLIRLDYLTGYLYFSIFALFFLELTKYKDMSFVRIGAGVYSVFMIGFVFLTSHTIYTSIYIQYLWLLAVLLVFIAYQFIRYYKRDVFHSIIMLLVVGNTMMALIVQMFVSKASYLPVAMLNAIIALTVIESIKIVSSLRKKDMLAFRAMIDPLTGLYNRHYMSEIRDHSELNEEDGNHYMLFMDLDGFKKVNDEYGHDVGDHVLQIVSQRLRGCLRASDTLIRYGGDEFVLVAEVNDSKEVEELAKRIIDKISLGIIHEGNKHSVGISIGISQCQCIDQLNITSGIKASDEAMYIAKKKGGSKYEFHKVFE